MSDSSRSRLALVLGVVLLAACGSDGGGAIDAADSGPSTGDGGAGADGSSGSNGGGSAPACALSYSELNASAKVNAQSTYAWTCTETTRS